MASRPEATLPEGTCELPRHAGPATTVRGFLNGSRDDGAGDGAVKVAGHGERRGGDLGGIGRGAALERGHRGLCRGGGGLLGGRGLQADQGDDDDDRERDRGECGSELLAAGGSLDGRGRCGHPGSPRGAGRASNCSCPLGSGVSPCPHPRRGAARRHRAAAPPATSKSSGTRVPMPYGEGLGPRKVPTSSRVTSRSGTSIAPSSVVTGSPRTSESAASIAPDACADASWYTVRSRSPA